MREVRVPAELEGAPAMAAELSAPPGEAGALAGGEQFTRTLAPPPPKDENHMVVERVREMAKLDPALTANVLRAWMENR